MIAGVIPDASEKRSLYGEARRRIEGLLEGEPDRIARMAGLVAVLHGLMPHYFWTGFYRVVGAELVIGPYQGTPGCGRIGWGKGVCGAAWRSGESQLVPDVHGFPGHIACDARSLSEVVVPVKDGAGRVIAVLDVDCAEVDGFTAVDVQELEGLVRRWIAPGSGGDPG